MPLMVIRNTETSQEAFDKHIMSGGLRVGRIYKRETTTKPELQFLRAINGVRVRRNARRRHGGNVRSGSGRAERELGEVAGVGEAARDRRRSRSSAASRRTAGVARFFSVKDLG
jgi:hypothetical protein